MNRQEPEAFAPIPKQEWISEYAIKSVSPRAKVIRNPNRRLILPQELIDTLRLLTKRTGNR
jgi:hypothetical protein